MPSHVAWKDCPCWETTAWTWATTMTATRIDLSEDRRSIMLCSREARTRPSHRPAMIFQDSRPICRRRRPEPVMRRLRPRSHIGIARAGAKGATHTDTRRARASTAPTSARLPADARSP